MDDKWYKFNQDAANGNRQGINRATMLSDTASLAASIHYNAIAKGFYDNCIITYEDSPPIINAKARNFGEMIALMHSELSEGLEAHRKDLKDDHLPEYDGWVVEFADTYIRMLDTLYGHNKIEQFVDAVLKKNEYNSKRPYKHGKAY